MDDTIELEKINDVFCYLYEKNISRDEQMRLIQECRNSGLSDCQWCAKNGISHSTFYRWIVK